MLLQRLVRQRLVLVVLLLLLWTLLWVLLWMPVVGRSSRLDRQRRG
jgi:hypothetical protein